MADFSVAVVTQEISGSFHLLKLRSQKIEIEISKHEDKAPMNWYGIKPTTDELFPTR